MHETSTLYKELLAEYMGGAPEVKFETSLAIGETGVLIDRYGDSITFGGVSILVGEASDGFNTRAAVKGNNTANPGECIRRNRRRWRL
mgnify:CR=1 FL=1